MINEIKDRYRIDLWSYEDFLAFALMYAALADNELVEDEVDLIVKRVGVEREEMARKIMEKLSDSERIDLILSFREKYFPTKADHEKLFNDMKEIFMADGKYNQLEQFIMMYLRRIL
ncbi:MAG: TerB family tellurite resistance protein [Flavobacteriales bacterium]|nr:TerB family tellurite resistance protein [Flavobacteriales bacterium]